MSTRPPADRLALAALTVAALAPAVAGAAALALTLSVTKLATIVRSSGAALAKAREAERLQLAGEWVLVESERGGAKVPAGPAPDRLTVSGERFRWVRGGETVEGSYFVNVMTLPRGLQFSPEGQQVIDYGSAAYRVEGDRLALLLSPANAPWQTPPADFSTAGNGNTSFVFRRTR